MVWAQLWNVGTSITPSLSSLALIATALSRLPPFTDVITLSTAAFPSVAAVRQNGHSELPVVTTTPHWGRKKADLCPCLSLSCTHPCRCFRSNQWTA